VSASTRISIALAVYNGERFISEQLESFVRQTRLPDELVVSDNASTDRTVEIVREFAARAPFPVQLFINDRNLGVTKNFERAIEESGGDLIFLSDCDDVWYPNKLLLMEAALRTNPEAGLAICDGDIVDQHLQHLGRRMWQTQRFRPSYRVRKMLAEPGPHKHRFPWSGNCIAFRAKFKPLILPLPDDSLYRYGNHDCFIALAISCSGESGVALLASPLLAYRQHDSQSVGLRESSRLDRVKGSWAARRRRPPTVLLPLIERLDERLPTRFVGKAREAGILRHFLARQTLPAEQIRRVSIIAREYLSGRYHQFSDGLKTAVKDLLFVR